MSVTSTSFIVFESLVVEQPGRSDQDGGLSATELLSATCQLDGGAAGLSY